MSQKQLVEIKIKKDGSFAVQAKEGFAGESCRKQTHDLEMVLGGEAVSTENTKEYYDDGGDMNANLDIKL
jgi:hypothetical protein